MLGVHFYEDPRVVAGQGTIGLGQKALATELDRYRKVVAVAKQK